MNSMKFPIFALLLALFPLAAASGADATPTPGPTPTPKPSILDHILHPFGGPKKKDNETEIKGTHFKHLIISMTMEPKVLKLSEMHEFKVTVTLVNRGADLVQMEYPTSQRIEVIIKTKAGKLVEQWSEDQAFVNEPSLVTINPNERLEYLATMATRDLIAGESYILEAFFPNYETMRTETPFVPQK
jgi:Intracellular proteinase inhibitor